MHPAFATIVFGPFATNYHREIANDSFKEALSAFLESELLPQVEQPYESTSGSLTAMYNEERYCGPHSALRDNFCLKFSFHGAAGDETLDTVIEFDPRSGSFKRHGLTPVYLWTQRRREKQRIEDERHDRMKRGIQLLCQRILKREVADPTCPKCSDNLKVTDRPDLFDIRCPSGCFNYNFHRDPSSGEFLHGHFRLRG